MRQQHARSSEGFIELTILPDVFAQTMRALDKLLYVLRGLRVDEQRMRQNLNLTKGQIMTEAVMMALAPRMGRLTAHDVLHSACVQASAEDRELLEVLKRDARVTDALSDSELSGLLEPASYLGNARETVGAIVSAASAALENRP